MKRKRTAPPKVQPWPVSIFALKTKWEDWTTDRHLWVFLERRVPGKFGRLEAMHAIVPKGRKKSELATIFGSARYRRGMLDSARELFRSAGVPDDQAAEFMQTITKEFPYPTPNEVFEEEISNPLHSDRAGSMEHVRLNFRTSKPKKRRAAGPLSPTAHNVWRSIATPDAQLSCESAWRCPPASYPSA